MSAFPSELRLQQMGNCVNDLFTQVQNIQQLLQICIQEKSYNLDDEIPENLMHFPIIQTKIKEYIVQSVNEQGIGGTAQYYSLSPEIIEKWVFESQTQLLGGENLMEENNNSFMQINTGKREYPEREGQYPGGQYPDGQYTQNEEQYIQNEEGQYVENTGSYIQNSGSKNIIQNPQNATQNNLQYEEPISQEISQTHNQYKSEIIENSEIPSEAEKFSEFLKKAQDTQIPINIEIEPCKSPYGKYTPTKGITSKLTHTEKSRITYDHFALGIATCERKWGLTRQNITYFIKAKNLFTTDAQRDLWMDKQGVHIENRLRTMEVKTAKEKVEDILNNGRGENGANNDGIPLEDIFTQSFERGIAMTAVKYGVGLFDLEFLLQYCCPKKWADMEKWEWFMGPDPGLGARKPRFDEIVNFALTEGYLYAGKKYRLPTDSIRKNLSLYYKMGKKCWKKVRREKGNGGSASTQFPNCLNNTDTVEFSL